MEKEVFQKVTGHMEEARQSVGLARDAVKAALLMMTDAEGVNLPFVKDVEYTLRQLLERFDLWQVQKRQESEDQPLPPVLDLKAQMIDAVYDGLLETFIEVRRPGRSGLVIFLQTYAQSRNVSADVLRRVIQLLQEQGRISARKMDYPGYVPEAWEISFIDRSDCLA